jgi:hypothetical protein
MEGGCAVKYLAVADLVHFHAGGPVDEGTVGLGVRIFPVSLLYFHVVEDVACARTWL